MREDQTQRLAALSEDLTDVVLTEANPQAWSGYGKAPAELTRDERGDRYWCKKNVAATLALLVRVEHVLANYKDRNPGRGMDDEPGIDAEIHRAEAEARKMLDRVSSANGQPTRGHA